MSLHQSPFLSNANYQTVVGFLRRHYATRMGSNSIPERMDSRIQKTVQHFMTEVAKIHGTQKPVQQLDQEVLREATKSLDTWLQRQDTVESPSPVFIRPSPVAALAPPVIPKAATVSAAAYSRPKVPATPTGVPVPPQTASFEEVSSLFRNRGQEAAWPAPIEDEEEDSTVLMKKAQKQRDSELLAGKVAPTMEIQELATTSVDPTPQSQPPPIRTAPLPQDYIIAQEPVVKYRNTEYNIFLTSSDRDWFRNRTENRYNFSVTFNPGNRSGYGYSPSVQERFRNIERIEFVKSILPTESLTQLIRSTANAASDLNSDRIVNVLSLPFVGVRIAELNNNGFSTNPREDNTFALVQYDATWNSATALNIANPGSTQAPRTTVGYTALIPKFLKCQKVYEPTPLAGLQKMSIRVERHDGAVLSNDCDVFSIDRICLSSDISGTLFGTDLTNYDGADNQYIYLKTSTYFPGSALAEGDLIHIQGFQCTRGLGTPPPAESTLLDFESFINTPGGLYVVAIANINAGNIVEGVNAAGYANVLILRSRFEDPTTGSTARSYFGGSGPGAGTQEYYLAETLNAQGSTTSIAALINLSRQTHFVLRVITRDMDSASNIRPDNV